MSEKLAHPVFQNRVSAPIRIFLFLFSFLPLSGGWRFLSEVYDVAVVQGYGFSSQLLVPALTGAACVLCGLFIILLPQFALSERVEFDLRRHGVCYTGKLSLGALSRKFIPFSEVRRMEVVTHEWSDRPTTYNIRLHSDTHEPIIFGHFRNRISADECLHYLRGLR